MHRWGDSGWLWPRNETEGHLVAEEQLDLARVYTTGDLCQSDDVHVAAMGIPPGKLWRGVQALSRSCRSG